MPKPPKPKSEANFIKLYESCGLVVSRYTGTGEAKEAIAEQCPFCSKEDHMYVNVKSGQYQCKSCGAEGNHFTFVRHYYSDCLEATTDSQFQLLKKLRGLSLQTLKRHGWAWDAAEGCWLIPFKSAEGNVMNLVRYWPPSGEEIARKWNLPGLPVQVYGLDQLSSNTNRKLFLCEGPFDAIALDQYLRQKKHRGAYDILAVPSAGTFQPGWAQHFGDRTVRICFDNDDAGVKGQDRAAKIIAEAKVKATVSVLHWPEGYPKGCDLSDLARDYPKITIAKFTIENCKKVVLAAEQSIPFVRGDAIPEEKVEWMCADHIPFGVLVSLSGKMGEHKSDIVRDLAARGTTGRPMLGSTEAVPAFDALYFTSEDRASRVRDLVRAAGGDLKRLHVYDLASETDPLDFLERILEVEAAIRSLGVRLVILDALNSFMGGDISTDAKARRTLSSKLQGLARRTGACIIGIRNWNRSDTGSGSQRSLGATSVADVARCVLNTRELDPEAGERRFQLEFEKVSDAPQPANIPYRIEDLSTGPDDSHLRRILWEKNRVPAERPAKKLAISASPKKVPQKGTSARTSRLTGNAG